MAKKFPQGDAAKKIIEHIQARKTAYYEANVTLRWRDACEAIKYALDQRPTELEENMTRSQLFLGTTLAAYDATHEIMTDAYGMADPLFVFSTKRNGTQQLAERAQWLLANQWEKARAPSNMQRWLGLCQDVQIYGQGVAWVRWEKQEGTVAAYSREKQPWGSLAAISMEKRTVLHQPIIERVHPYDHWCYWRSGHKTPWEGVTLEWTPMDVIPLLDDENYERRGLEAFLERLKRGNDGDDEYYYGSEDRDELPMDERTGMAYVYYGDLFGMPGFEEDTNEYLVVHTEQEILRLQQNRLSGYRPFKRPRAICSNDWSGGRPTLLPQVPHNKVANFLLNSGLDDVTDRLMAGWGMWEEALENPDEFMNPTGVGNFTRMKDGSPKEKLPVHLGQGSGIQQDVERIYNMVDRDRQAGAMQDVLSQKGGIQDGTARAANLIASQGARKSKSQAISMNDTGLTPIAEHMMLLTLLNTDPAELASQTRDGKKFSFGPEEQEMLLENNLWDFSDSFRMDQFLEADKMDRFLNAGASDYIMQNATDPETVTKLFREYAKYINLRNYPEYLPLRSEMEAEAQAQGGGMPAQEQPMAPQSPVEMEMAMAEQGAPQGVPAGAESV